MVPNGMEYWYEMEWNGKLSEMGWTRYHFTSMMDVSMNSII